MVLWQHIVLFKNTLLGMRLAMVCVVCYVVIDSYTTRHNTVDIMELFCECF